MKHWSRKSAARACRYIIGKILFRLHRLPRRHRALPRLRVQQRRLLLGLLRRHRRALHFPVQARAALCQQRRLPILLAMRRDRPRADGIQRLRQLPDVIREVSNSLPEEIALLVYA